jgi:hypothetical protein
MLGGSEALCVLFQALDTEEFFPDGIFGIPRRSDRVLSGYA